MLRPLSIVFIALAGFWPAGAFAQSGDIDPSIRPVARPDAAASVTIEPPTTTPTLSTKAIRPMAPRPLRSALSAMRLGRWDAAVRIAPRAGPAAEVLVEWHRLQAGIGDPEDILSFLQAHDDWPGLEALRARSELAIVDATAEQTIAFFQNRVPQSGLGALAYARALEIHDRKGDADATLVMAWLTLDLTTAEHEAFMKARSELLAPYHTARLDMALWRGLRDVQLMLPLVDKATRDVAETRLMIEKDRDGADKRLETLPASAKSNPHIAYALFNRHIRNNRSDEAVKLLRRQSRRVEGLGEPARWAGWRRALARARMRDGAARTAYDLASVHGLVEGSNYADLEWLSGYLALTYLDTPELAALHFRNFLDVVETPISLGRGGYWLGRAEEAKGNASAAAIAYELGALHQTSFYGLLAAERGGFPFDTELAGNTVVPDWQQAHFAEGSLFQAAMLAYASGEPNLSERLFRQLAGTLDSTGVAQLGEAIKDLGSPHLQVMIGKAAARNGIAVAAPYYPLHPMQDLELPVPMELALAIARRESEFDTSVTSGAGAVGLMQLMPATAAEVARSLGETGHSRVRLFRDWAYNARLGSTYLAQMAQQFDGNIVLMSAAYNAGPSRPTRWMSQFGDPRQSEFDVVDWIEHVPFNETRNYIMRVTESLPVYRARLGRDPLPIPFSQELVGNTFLPKVD